MFTRPAHRFRRISTLRPLRPPNNGRHQFTNRRPQLPYLASATTRLPYRLLSTESRTFLVDFTRQTSKSILFFGTIGVLGMIALTAWHMESEERKHPTPSEWSWQSRDRLRKSREEIRLIEEGRRPVIDWPLIGSVLKDALKRLENPKQDGKGLVEQGEGDEGILVPGVGKAGYDISSQSYEWRAGYHEVLLRAATAAEHLENLVLDKKRDMFYPEDCVVGPSNPDPRPVPRYFKDTRPPQEEDCVPFYERPEVFYMRILTTKGFDTRQKLEAMEGYANYLAYKGLNESAEEMLRWGVDIAKAALPENLRVEDVIDAKTNVLSEAAQRLATENLLRAATGLATQFARTGDTASALPILLSVLRARRTAPLELEPAFPLDFGPKKPETDIGAFIDFFRRLLRPTPFPPLPPSGDLPLTRHTEQPTCEEGELMVYVGEIIFTSANAGGRAEQERRTEGIGWTRQGALTAGMNLKGRSERIDGEKIDAGTRERRKVEDRKCKECFLTGVRNWETMLKLVSSQRLNNSDREGGAGKKGGWFGWASGKETLEERPAEDLEAELAEVEKMKERILREGIEDELKRNMPQGIFLGF